MLLDAKPSSYRYKVCKTLEEEVIDCLNTHYKEHNYDLTPSSNQEDRKDKIDCWQKSSTGKLLPSAVKVRFSRNDILVAMRDPFYGFDHEDTTMGRDMLQEYFQYITLSPDQETIRVASGKKIHAICQDIWQELEDKNLDIQMTEPPYNKGKAVKLLRSEKHEGCEIWLHFDRSSGRPKLLGFIPPSLLKENKEIKYHKFLRENKNE